MEILSLEGLEYFWLQILARLDEKAPLKDLEILKSNLTDLKEFSKKDLDTLLVASEETGFAADSGAVSKKINIINNELNQTKNNLYLLTESLNNNVYDFLGPEEAKTFSNLIESNSKILTDHLLNLNNPHQVTAKQVGLDKVANLSVDEIREEMSIASTENKGLLSNIDKQNLDLVINLIDITDPTKINTRIDNSINSATLENKKYTDDSIKALIGSAPETLNTIYEIAAALKNNSEVIDVLNESISNKINKNLVENTVSEDNLILTSNTINTIVSNLETTIQNNHGDSSVEVLSGSTENTYTFYPTGITNVSTGGLQNYNALVHYKGIVYQTLNGSESKEGISRLILGNSTATGNAGNKEGRLSLYSSGKALGTLIQKDNGSSEEGNSIISFLPAEGGELLSDKNYQKYSLPLKGGTITGNVNIGNSNSSDNYFLTFRRLISEEDSRTTSFYTNISGFFTIELTKENEVLNFLKLSNTETLLKQPLSLSSGGTGAKTADAARINLGITPQNIGAIAIDSIIDCGIWD